MNVSLKTQIRFFKLGKWVMILFAIVLTIAMIFGFVIAVASHQSTWHHFDAEQLKTLSSEDLPVVIMPYQEILVSSSSSSSLTIETCCVEFQNDTTSYSLNSIVIENVNLPPITNSGQWWRSNVTYRIKGVEDPQSVIQVRLNEVGRSRHYKRTENDAFLPFVGIIGILAIDVAVLLIAWAFRNQQVELEVYRQLKTYHERIN